MMCKTIFLIYLKFVKFHCTVDQSKVFRKLNVTELFLTYISM